MSLNFWRLRFQMSLGISRYRSWNEHHKLVNVVAGRRSNIESKKSNPMAVQAHFSLNLHPMLWLTKFCCRSMDLKMISFITTIATSYNILRHGDDNSASSFKQTDDPSSNQVRPKVQRLSQFRDTTLHWSVEFNCKVWAILLNFASEGCKNFLVR